MNAPFGMDRQDFLTQAHFSGNRRLLPHQITQAIFAVERARSLNASETGTGKFLVALAMRRLVEHEAGHIVRCLRVRLPDEPYVTQTPVVRPMDSALVDALKSHIASLEGQLVTERERADRAIAEL